ncbi:hypothetical protein [Nocardioides bruguierae]|uniref:Uncharacterized protein n=1 Tax=Nocardioides bruguierae TaxID=2945102 RepID=A0A9X2D8G7_9ACTN|nr:hypothetical protein [Nocardioides bruguierae]MCM0619979.1 hypothetical protein [Nocardioides bruguierae]
MDDHTDENVLRPRFGGRRAPAPRRAVEVPGHVLAADRLGPASRRLARQAFRKGVRAWAADPEAGYPDFEALEAAALAELRLVADALGPWARPEHDPFEVLTDPEWPRDEGDAGFSF